MLDLARVIVMCHFVTLQATDCPTLVRMAHPHVPLQGDLMCLPQSPEHGADSRREAVSSGLVVAQ